jgi:hypothetical protein
LEQIAKEYHLYDVIPDIHGQAQKLIGALGELGYRERNGAWRHSDPSRHAVFLGDFIDRGPENGKVIRIVRSMVDAGTELRPVFRTFCLLTLRGHFPSHIFESLFWRFVADA